MRSPKEKGSKLFITMVFVVLIYWKRKELKSMILDLWDKYTNSRIRSLHPIIRARVSKFIHQADTELGIKLRITQDGHLRSFEYQNELYAQGRIENGRIVTYAKGGESYHNYGLAFDIVEIKDDEALWHNPNWYKIGKLGESFGFEWGGNWAGKRNDKPHFQFTMGFSVNDLYAIYNTGNTQNGYVKLA